MKAHLCLLMVYHNKDIQKLTACNARTDYFVFSDRATVGQIIVGDTLYANSSKTTVFNGGLEWYSISNTLGLLPQPSNDKYLINSSWCCSSNNYMCCNSFTKSNAYSSASDSRNINSNLWHNKSYISR